MNAPAPVSHCHAAMLAELGRLGMDLAREAHAAALAAEAPSDKAEMMLAFHRVARAVRMTIALEARLAADAARAGRQAADQRRGQVRAAVGRVILGRARDKEHAEGLFRALELRLEEERLFDELPEVGVDELIGRIRKDLGLPAAGPARPPRRPGPAPLTFRRVIVRPPIYAPDGHIPPADSS